MGMCASWKPLDDSEDYNHQNDNYFIPTLDDPKIKTLLKSFETTIADEKDQAKWKIAV